MAIRTLASFLVICVLATPASAKIRLADVANYLQGLARAKAEFTQVSADGSISTGDLYIRRPGRARFDYDPPNKGLVIAGGGQVAIFDPVSNTPPEQYPLGRTPLGLILADVVNLSRGGSVVRHTGDANSTSVTLQDPANPQAGRIELVFTPNPVQLRQWVITDDGGQQTTVILGDLATNASVGSGLFNIPQEMQRRGLSN